MDPQALSEDVLQGIHPAAWKPHRLMSNKL